MGTMRLPTRLAIEPLAEVIFEVRFQSAVSSVGSLLPGLLFQTFRSQYKSISKLPVASLPSELLDNDANLRYSPHTQLVGDGFTMQLGSRVASLAHQPPYVGWTAFKARIGEFTEALSKTQLIDRIERFSIKTTDLLPLEIAPSLDALEVEIKLPTGRLATEPTHLRTECRQGGFTTILQAMSPADMVRIGSPKQRGVVLDIDVIRVEGLENFWNDAPTLLEEAHQVAKHLFFKLLKKETLEKLGPEY